MKEPSPQAQPAVSQRNWQRIARRIRVPLGFCFAAIFLILAKPGAESLTVSLLLVVPGLCLRGYAAGYVKKNEELTTTGPYAYTRNPLYLGSMLIAFGFAAASQSVLLIVLLTALFFGVYVPTIRSEEEFLRSRFPQFDAYVRAVPRLLPRVTAAPGTGAAGHFSRERYLHHREYNSLIGAGALYAALLLRLLLLKHP